jgi:hypothetical protein
LENHKPPPPPRTNNQHHNKGKILISSEDQTKLSSGVGMLLYLVRHSRPDIANAVSDLSKVSDRSTKDNYNKVLRSIKFFDTKYLPLK